MVRSSALIPDTLQVNVVGVVRVVGKVTREVSVRLSCPHGNRIVVRSSKAGVEVQVNSGSVVPE